MSADLTGAPEQDDAIAREAPRMRAAWPAWVLLLVAGLAFFLQIARGTPEDVDGLRGLALSAAALERGEWWTLLTHAVVQRGFTGHLAGLAVLTGMGLITLAARDKDWMGGWRTIGVFALTSAAGVVTYFLSGSDEPLSGMWPGLLGLAGFYLTSGRMLRAAPPINESYSRERKQVAGGALTGWVLLWLNVDTSNIGDLVSIPGVNGWVWLAVFGGGIAAILIVHRWGTGKVMALLTAGLSCAYAMFVALWVISMARGLLSVPGEALVDLGTALLGTAASLLGAGAIGLALGAIERGWTRLVAVRD